MEEIVKTIQTRKGGTVSLIKPDNGLPFFRYLAGAVATTDSFRYVIRQHGQEDTATVNIQVNQAQNDQPDDQKDFNKELAAFLHCVETFMDGTPGTMALTNLLGIDEGDVLNDDWMQKIFAQFKYFDYALEGDAIEFERHLGTYHYVDQEGYWEFQPGGNAIVFRFPSSPEAETHDAEWRTHHLKTVPVKTEDGLYHLPISMETQLSIGDKVLLGLRIKEINYLDGTLVPAFIDLEAVVWPYVLELNLESKDQREFTIRGSITDSKGCQLGLDTMWTVNQDLREDLEEEHIHMSKGALHLNQITFSNLASLYEAARTEVDDQDVLDKMVNVECLLKGRKIGDVRYLIKEEVVEMTYLDGTRQNISDIVINFFEKYFAEEKPSGEARNNAFNLAAPVTHRAVLKPAYSMRDVKIKTITNLTQAVRKRTIRNGDSFSDLAKGLSLLFKEEQKADHPIDSTVYSPDFPGSFTPTPDFGMFNPEPAPGIVNPGITGHNPFVTPEDKPRLTPQPGVIKNPEIVPPKVSKNPKIKPGNEDIKVIDSGINPAIKPAIAKPVKPKAAAIKPATPSVKPAIAAKPKTTAKKASVAKTKPKAVAAPVSAAGAKTKPKAVAAPVSSPGAKTKPKAVVAPVSATGAKTKPKAVKAPAIKSVEGVGKVAAKPATVKKITKPK